MLIDPDLSRYRRDPREFPEPPRLLPPDDLGDDEEERPPPEARGELERVEGELALGDGRLGADGRLILGELWLLGCRLVRGEREGLDRTSGIRERAGDGEVVARGVLLEESDPPTLGDRDDPEREDEFLSTLDSGRTGADDVLEERLFRMTGPLSVGLFRR